MRGMGYVSKPSAETAGISMNQTSMRYLQQKRWGGGGRPSATGGVGYVPPAKKKK